MKNERVTVVEDSPFIPVIIEEDGVALVQQLKAGRTIKGQVGSLIMSMFGSFL